MPIKAISHQHLISGLRVFEPTCLILIVSKKSVGSDLDFLYSGTNIPSYILMYESPENGGSETFLRLQGTPFKIERDWSLYLLVDSSIRVKYSQRPRNEQDINNLVKDILSKVRPVSRGPIYPTPQSASPAVQNHNMLQPNRSMGGQVNVSMSSSKLLEGDETTIPYNQNWRSLLQQ